MITSISVILPTYNGATRGEGKYLKQAIESVLNQSYSNFELIIINDGSKDNTEEIIKQYKDNRIIYLKHDINKGPAAARNTALKEATGEYIAFLDDDDYYLPNKLEDQLKFMIKNNVNISICGGFIIKENNKFLYLSKNKVKKFIHTLDIYLDKINFFPDTIMIKNNMKDILFKENLKAAVDWDYVLRLSMREKILMFPQRLFAYRIHQSNLTKNLESIFYYRLLISFELKNELIKYFNKPEHYYFYNLHSVYSINSLKEFRKFYKIVNPLGKAPIEWKIKYLLSYFPFLTKLTVKLKLKDKFYKFVQNYLHFNTIFTL